MTPFILPESSSKQNAPFSAAEGQSLPIGVLGGCLQPRVLKFISLFSINNKQLPTW
jgi:hypothetical protein